MREARSRTLQLNTFSRLRLCAGESSSSKMTVSTSARRQCNANSSALPLPIKVAAHGAGSFCEPSPTTKPPADAASSESSSMESGPLLAFLSSTPIRKTLSVFRFRVSINAFNSVLYRLAHLSIASFAREKKQFFDPIGHGLLQLQCGQIILDLLSLRFFFPA